MTSGPVRQHRPRNRRRREGSSEGRNLRVEVGPRAYPFWRNSRASRGGTAARESADGAHIAQAANPDNHTAGEVGQHETRHGERDALPDRNAAAAKPGDAGGSRRDQTRNRAATGRGAAFPWGQRFIVSRRAEETPSERVNFYCAQVAEILREEAYIAAKTQIRLRSLAEEISRAWP